MFCHSKHSTTHGEKQELYDYVMAEVYPLQVEDTLIEIDGDTTTYYGAKHRVQGRNATPLNGLLKVAAKQRRTPKGNKYYDLFAVTGRTVEAKPVPGEGHYQGKYWNYAVPKTKHPYTHMEIESGPTVSSSAVPAPQDPVHLSISTDLLLGCGPPDLENPDPLEDMAVALRVTSSVDTQTDGSLKYTYLLQNFTDQDWDFAVPEITSSAAPGGWVGMVAAESSETFVVNASASEDVMKQNAQLNGLFGTLEEGASRDDHECGFSAPVYCPRSRLVFDGAVVLESATRAPGSSTVAVQFHVTGAVARHAYLFRVAGDGVIRVVAEIEQVMNPSIQYELVDNDAVLGTATYFVGAGVEPNGVRSEDAVVGD